MAIPWRPGAVFSYGHILMKFTFYLTMIDQFHDHGMQRTASGACGCCRGVNACNPEMENDMDLDVRRISSIDGGSTYPEGNFHRLCFTDTKPLTARHLSYGWTRNWIVS
jgi:hypothetical protein